MKEPHQTIHISSTTVFTTLLYLVGFILLYLIRDVVLLVLTAVVIASAIEPGTKWLVKRKFPRTAAVLLIYFLILLFFALIFYFLIPQVIRETSSFVSSLPQYVQVAELWGPLKHIAVYLNIPQTIQVTDIISTLSRGISYFSGGFFVTATNFVGGVFSTLLVVVISFYLAVKENGIVDFLEIVIPARHEAYAINLWKRTQVKIGRWMQGQLLLQLIVGILIYLGLVILRVPHSLLLAIFAFIFELIPIFGMSLAAIPAALLAMVQGGFTMGLLVVGLYLIVQQFESNLIYPLVVRKVVGVPSLLVIIALVAGAKLAGFLGIILSVPISVAIMEYFDDLGKKKSQARLSIGE